MTHDQGQSTIDIVVNGCSFFVLRTGLVYFRFYYAAAAPPRPLAATRQPAAHSFAAAPPRALALVHWSWGWSQAQNVCTKA